MGTYVCLVKTCYEKNHIYKSYIYTYIGSKVKRQIEHAFLAWADQAKYVLLDQTQL